MGASPQIANCLHCIGLSDRNGKHAMKQGSRSRYHASSHTSTAVQSMSFGKCVANLDGMTACMRAGSLNSSTSVLVTSNSGRGVGSGRAWHKLWSLQSKLHMKKRTYKATFHRGFPISFFSVARWIPKRSWYALRKQIILTGLNTMIEAHLFHEGQLMEKNGDSSS